MHEISKGIALPLDFPHGISHDTVSLDSSTSTFQPRSWKSLLGLEIVQQHVPLLALFAPVPHNHATAIDNFSSIALTIKHAQPSPLAQHLSVRHLDERNLVFRAKGDDEFLVCFFFTAFVQDTHVCLAAVKGLAGFPQATGEAVVDKGEFEDTYVRIDSQRTGKCKMCAESG